MPTSLLLPDIAATQLPHVGNTAASNWALGSNVNNVRTKFVGTSPQPPKNCCTSRLKWLVQMDGGHAERLPRATGFYIKGQRCTHPINSNTFKKDWGLHGETKEGPIRVILFWPAELSVAFLQCKGVCCLLLWVRPLPHLSATSPTPLSGAPISVALLTSFYPKGLQLLLPHYDQLVLFNNLWWRRRRGIWWRPRKCLSQ